MWTYFSSFFTVVLVDELLKNEIKSTTLPYICCHTIILLHLLFYILYIYCIHHCDGLRLAHLNEFLID